MRRAKTIMNEEKENLAEDKLTDEQVEQVSGGRKVIKGGVDDINDGLGNGKKTKSRNIDGLLPIDR